MSARIFMQRWLRIDGDKNEDYRIHQACCDLLKFKVEGPDADRVTLSNFCDPGDEITLVSYATFRPDSATAFVAVNPLLYDVAEISAPSMLIKPSVGPLVVRVKFREQFHLNSLTWLARIWENKILNQPEA